MNCHVTLTPVLLMEVGYTCSMQFNAVLNLQLVSDVTKRTRTGIQKSIENMTVSIENIFNFTNFYHQSDVSNLFFPSSHLLVRASF